MGGPLQAMVHSSSHGGAAPPAAGCPAGPSPRTCSLFSRLSSCARPEAKASSGRQGLQSRTLRIASRRAPSHDTMAAADEEAAACAQRPCSRSWVQVQPGAPPSSPHSAAAHVHRRRRRAPRLMLSRRAGSRALRRPAQALRRPPRPLPQRCSSSPARCARPTAARCPRAWCWSCGRGATGGRRRPRCDGPQPAGR